MSSTALLVGGLVVALVAHVADTTTNRGHHNAPFAPGVSITSFEGRAGFRGEPGKVGITSLLRIDVSAPLTVLGVEPYDRSTGVEVLAVRAVFHGRGVSPGGYRMVGGYPTTTCTTSWPGFGFGPSYPVRGLRLVPGDPVQFVYYLRAPGVGLHVARGYRVTYRTDDGQIRVATGDRARFEMDLRAPAELAGLPGRCHDDPGRSWVEAAPGYPE